MAHLTPAAIMFFITVLFATLFFIPVTKFPRKNKLINFYWSGFWIYLAIISSIAGASSTLLIIRFDAIKFADNILAGIIASFMFFVMFAWFRLSGKAIILAIKHLRNKKLKATN